MQKRIRKRFMSVLMSAAVFAGSFSTETIKAAEAPAAEWQTCTVYEGRNIEAQNYARWTNPIKSYLTVCENGNLMRVQSGSMDGILVEYYDTSYRLLSSELIPSELPIFGGFYATDRYNFLLTGQENPNESESVEIYRITKYDKDWNKITSVGLSDCNTTVPFDAGCARMDTAGNYLLIRTCHEMYQSSDGLNHQSNVTIQVDMESMQITDSFTGVMNSSYGYISHSFNQFIKVEDNHIIAVDHGDAYPRSIALTKYATDVSTGKFLPNYNSTCSVTDVLTFPGPSGHNTTGASIGGFEITNSSYLIAGNSVIQDDDNLTRTTRNVFVAAVDKNTGMAAEMNWFTNYEEGDGTTSTPQLVKTGDDSCVVLWSRDNKVYYAKTGGNGGQIGEIYEMAGSLSDCVPVVAGDKLVWYTWRNAAITFYEIDLNDLSESRTKQIENGHVYEDQNEMTDGSVELTCKYCGLTEQIKVVTGMSIFWNEDTGTGSYSSRFNSKKERGEKLYYWIYSVSPEDADNKEIEIRIEDPEIMQWSETSETMGYFTMLKPGKTTITFCPKYNPQAARTYECEVQGSTLSANDFVFTPPENLICDGEEKTANVEKREGLTGAGEITIKYYDSNQNLLDSAPKTAGTYTVKIDVSAGTEYSAVTDLEDDSWKFTVMEAPLIPQPVMNVSHALKTVGNIVLSADWKWSDDDKDKILNAGETITAVAEYTGEGTVSPIQVTIIADDHKGGIATCSKEAVCEICNETYGSKDLSYHNISPVYYWSEDYKACTVELICSFGNETVSSQECEVHSVVTEATCENAEKTVYTAACIYDGTVYEDTKEAKTSLPLGHNYVNGTCSRCGDKQIPGVDEGGDPTPAPGSTPTPGPTPKPSLGDIVPDQVTGVYYKITKSTAQGGTVSFMKADNNPTKVVIPDTITINGITYKVTGIMKNAFKGCTKLKTVTIGKNVTSIGDGAFYKCTALTKIIIPKGVSKIGKQAFYGAKKLKSVTIRTTKLTGKKIGKQAFKNIHSKAVVKVPSKKLGAYKKILKARGVTGKKQKIKK